MDKSSKISIKINGEEKKYEEEKVDSSRKEDVQFEEFNWVLPTPDGLGKKVIVLDDVKKKKKKKTTEVKKTKVRKKLFSINSSSKSIIISIISASLIGLCFGFVFLGIFKQAKPNAKGSTIEEHSLIIPKSENITIQKVVFDLAQVGMFNTKEAAQKSVDGLADLGYKGYYYKKNNAYFVVIGLSGKDSTFLTDEVKKKYKDVYLKQEEIAGMTYKGPKTEVEMLRAEIETFQFLLSYLTNENFTNEKQLEQIKSTILILNNNKKAVKNKQLIKGLYHLENIEKVVTSEENGNLNKVTEKVQNDLLSVFKILKEQNNTLTN